MAQEKPPRQVAYLGNQATSILALPLIGRHRRLQLREARAVAIRVLDGLVRRSAVPVASSTGHRHDRHRRCPDHVCAAEGLVLGCLLLFLPLLGLQGLVPREAVADAYCCYGCCGTVGGWLVLWVVVVVDTFEGDDEVWYLVVGGVNKLTFLSRCGLICGERGGSLGGRATWP